MEIVEGIWRDHYRFPSKRPKTNIRHHPQTLEGILAHTVVNENGCRIWQGGVDDWGYGMKKWGKGHRRVHRLVYEFVKGPITTRLVRHTCDTPRCCEPTHLIAGTDQDNADDKVQRGRGRWASGEKAHNAKLTNTAVLDIRKKQPKGRAPWGQMIRTKLAKKYRVSESAIQNVWDRKTWKDIG